MDILIGNEMDLLSKMSFQIMYDLCSAVGQIWGFKSHNKNKRGKKRIKNPSQTMQIDEAVRLIMGIILLSDMLVSCH